jgi:hypothetical protein
MGDVTTMRGVFPLHEDKRYTSESEWVILKLLCRPLHQLDQTYAAELSAASGGQISEARSDELIRIVRISRLAGLGTWMARLLAEINLDVDQVMQEDASVMMEAINRRAGYPICNEATTHAFARLQQQWAANHERVRE